MSILLDSYNRIKLLNEIKHAVGKAFENRTLSEPQLIANLTYFLPKFLNNITLANSSVRFEVGAIFTHQKPYVENIAENIAENWYKYPHNLYTYICRNLCKIRGGNCYWHLNWKKKYVELGDVLFINNLVVNGSLEHQRALLLQAKKENLSLGKSPIPDNKEQLDLYTNWPIFAYTRTSNSKLNGAERCINFNYEADIFDGAKYLLIDDNNKSNCNIGDYVARANFPELTNFSSFIIELYDFILGNAGKEFNLEKLSSEDIGWSRIIDDLIDNICTIPLSKNVSDTLLKKSDINKLQRGQGKLSGSFSQHGCINNKLNSNNKLDFTNNNSNSAGSNNMEDAGGLSVIEITTLVNNDK